MIYYPSKNNDELYTQEMFEKELKEIYCDNNDIIDDILREGYKNFVKNNKLSAPSKELSESVLSQSILKQLNVKSKNELKYVKGSFLVPNKLNFLVGKQEYFKNGGHVILGNSCKIREIVSHELKENTKKPLYPEHWYNRRFPSSYKSKDYLYHKGHLIARSFQNYTSSRKIIRGINDAHNIIIASNWSNGATHESDNIGINQSYIENKLIEILKDDHYPNVKIGYEVIALFEDEEVVPRGIHIQAKIEGRQDRKFDTLNIFIPNVDSRFKVRYSRGRNFFEKVTLESREDIETSFEEDIRDVFDPESLFDEFFLG